MGKPHRTLLRVIFVSLLVVLFILIYTCILQNRYSKDTLQDSVKRNTQCADAIYQLVSDSFTKEDFENITTVDDMKSDRYKELQGKLNELRTLNSTRYLYTAARGKDGKLIYLVDGLDLDAEDFAYPGTYIEKEMIPYIDAALSGETIYSQDSVDTTWGHIFTACYPIRSAGDSGEIIGALCLEMNMESTYEFLAQSKITTIEIATMTVVVSLLLAVCIYVFLNRQKQKELIQQQLLQESAVKAEAANRAKSAFLFNMSHDIRTPMNAIIGYAELAGRSQTSRQELNDYLGKIHGCGQTLLSILDNVLELSKIESGNVVLEESAVEAGSIFEKCMQMVEVELEKKHQTLTISKEIIHPYVYFDTTRVTEVILNLVSNAIKYTGDGGRIDCVIKQSPHPKEGWVYHEMSVKDNGIGMSEEFQSHIFEIFVREKSTTDSGIEGTGLGMGIVKKLVDLMDGTIEVESKVGEGSIFTFRIPCRIASFEETQPKRADEAIEDSKLRGHRILLAEDNDLNAEIAIALLEEKGLLVERGANGVECIEMLEKKPVDYYELILMDVQMPILDGYEATKKIRQMGEAGEAGIPIIAITANAFAEDKKKALEVGMNAHVAKPIDMNVLVPTLKKYLL